MERVIAKVLRFFFLHDANSLTSYAVGDFGLATSSLAAVDPSDVSPHAAVTESTDMTLGEP